MDEYKIKPSVFYRIYDNCVVAYDTQQQKVFQFNETAGDTLDCFQEYSSIDKATGRLLALYSVEDEEGFRGDIRRFITELYEKGLLGKKHSQIEVIGDLEKQISGYFAEGEQLCTVTMELTYRCNEKCRHCYIAGDDRAEMSFDTLKGLMDELSEMNVLNLVFTGGDIFTRSDVFDILEYAYAKHFLIDIFTNGNLIDGNDYIRLKQIYPRCIHFSLYSHISEKHDAITQVKGSFEKTLKSIRACIAIGIPVNIKTPIFDETRGDIKGIVDLANDLGCSVELGRNVTPKKNGDLSPLQMKIKSEEDEKEVIDTIQSLVQTVENYPESNGVREKLCGAGDRSISINPYGEVFPCNMLQFCIGNINEASIQEIWNHSERLAWWRNNNKRTNRTGCENCEYVNQCVFCPGEAMMREGSPLAKYDEACTMTNYAMRRKAKSTTDANLDKIKETVKL